MFKNILGVAAFIVLAGFFLNWTNGQDKVRAMVADQYAMCIKYEYGMNPTAYYDTHGEYPTCASSTSWTHQN